MEDVIMQFDKRLFLGNLMKITMGAIAAPVAKAAEAPAGKPRYVMVVDLRRCVGCQACTVGCSFENTVPLKQFRTSVDQIEVSEGGRTAFMMLPRLCNQCDDPPCVKACPTGATFKMEDGIVVVDSDWCVGCGYCVEACPYDMRFINKETHVADKCTFCRHRLEHGLLPACVETCVGGARVIGDVSDPESTVSKLLRGNKDDIHVLRPEEKTRPRVFYIGLEAMMASHISPEHPADQLIFNARGEEVAS